MRLSVKRFGLRYALGVVGVIAAVGTAVFVVAQVGEEASASSRIGVTVTAVEIGNSSSHGQAEALSDGQVSDAEMRETMQQVVECIDAEGNDATLVEFNPGLGWHIAIDAPTAADAERASATLDACSAAYDDVLDAYWSENRLTPAEQAQFESLVRECLVANGVELMRGRSLAASVPVESGDRFTKCQQEALTQIR